MNAGRRAWCFLVHRWWVPTARSPMPTALGTPYTRGMYFCLRCGEMWNRS